MKTLSIRQPWSTLILLETKTIEIRSRNTHYRGQFLIHTGKEVDGEAMDVYKIIPKYFGYIVGHAELSEVKEYTGLASFKADFPKHKCWWDPIRFPLFGYVLTNVRALEPIKTKGQLGFFEVDSQDIDFDSDHTIVGFS